MNVELRDEALGDLENGATFYGEQSAGLDEYFLKCLREDIKKLKTTGGVHRKYHGFHRSLSNRFPYAIYYLVVEEVVDVVAVLDCRRDPAALNTRLGRTKRCTKATEQRGNYCHTFTGRLVNADVRRLKNSEVCNLNDHRLNVDQEERTKRLLVDVVQTFG